MPTINDEPPQKIKDELANLRVDLDVIPSKAIDNNLLIATWNICHFGDLTKEWESSSNDSPKRDLHSLLCIGEIISRFDVIAIQEIKSNLGAFRHLLKWLGPNWEFLITDETKGKKGNRERLGFIFDTRKVQLSGLACELVVPSDPYKNEYHALDQQFARTPYAVGFKAGGKTFILVTLHVLYGKSNEPEKRIPELKEIAVWLKDWAHDVNSWDHNLIALGDFNIDRKNDPLWQAFTSTGLKPPKELDDALRTISHKPSKPKFYDQIAWFVDEDDIPALSLKYKSSGYFDFKGKVLIDRNLSNTSLKYHISDHYPLWVEFETRDLPEN